MQLLPGPMWLKRSIEGFVTNCLDYKSELVMSKAGSHAQLESQSSRRAARTAIWAKTRRRTAIQSQPKSPTRDPATLAHTSSGVHASRGSAKGSTLN